MNKLKDFTKKYGFYLAVGVISVSAVGAAIVLSQNTTQVDNPNGAYVEDVLDQNVDVEEDNLEDVVTEMLNKKISYTLVLENEKLVGIVTKSDLIKHF